MLHKRIWPSDLSPPEQKEEKRPKNTHTLRNLEERQKRLRRDEQKGIREVGGE